MTLVPLPALADNYFWMLKRGPVAIERDPGSAQPTPDILGRDEPQLAAILVTPSRTDRAGSVAIRPAPSNARSKSNSFLRPREATLLEAMRRRAGLSGTADDAQLFTALRQWKTDF